MTEENNQLSKNAIALRYMILKACVNRMNELDLKGKKREEATMHFLVGATNTLHFTDNELSKNMIAMLSWVLSIRGYSEVLLMVNAYEKENPEAKAKTE